jgi:putative phosphoribosyl transferase
MLFIDRCDGGRRLVLRLIKYKEDPNAIVIGLPRGGVVTAGEVAHGLRLPLDVICPRKIGAPFQHELALGAITETGEGIFDEKLISFFHVSQEYLDCTIAEEKAVAQRRLAMFRKNRPKLDLEGKTVILVDDGLATGATMKVAIKSVHAAGAERIVVAVPVSPPDTYDEISELVDEAIALYTPASFQAVGQFYSKFLATEDSEVVDILQANKAPI